MKSLGELFYNLAALALVAALAYFFWWGFVAVVGTSVLLSLTLIALERSLS